MMTKQKTSSVSKIYGLNDWVFRKKIPDNTRPAHVNVYLKSLSFKKLLQLNLAKRKEIIDEHYKKGFARLTATGLFDSYEMIGSKNRPRGVETTLPYKNLEPLSKYAFIDSIFINAISGATRRKNREIARFFCIKMTVAIQVESVNGGMQTYEERFVLIKARTSDEAYKKIERQRNKYESPYINPYGQLVRWKVESLDDCYITGIVSCEDLNDPEGAEVYSVLKKRKLTTERYWDGKMD